MNRQKIIDLMMDLVKESGRLALSYHDNAQVRLKPDASVLTEADLAISRLVQDALKNSVAQGECVLIEEEAEGQNQTPIDAARFMNAPYVWSVDPIDGTRAYANRMPLYGISIGVLKDLRPWMSAVYMPSLREMFFCDGNEAWFVQNPFSKQERRQRITPVEVRISQQSLFLAIDMFFKYFEWDYSLCRVILPACAVIDLCWPALGRACGCLFNAYLWDFAGSWPIARAAGLDLRRISDGSVLDRAVWDLFKHRPDDAWRLKDFYILSTENNFKILKNALRYKRREARP